MASSTSSTLSRYKPTILIITGVACALGIYYSLDAFASQPSGSTLHRSNAVSRRPRARARPERRPLAGTEEIGNRDDEVPATDGDASYGGWSFVDDDDFTHLLELKLSTLPTLEDLELEYGLSMQSAAAVFESMQSEYALRWIGRHYPHTSAESEPRLSSSDTYRIAVTLGRLGISPHSIQVAIENHTERIRIDAVQTTESAEVPTVNRASLDAVSELGAETEAGTDIVLFEQSLEERDGQGLRQVLYYIAEHQSREDGYIHRGVTCNSCDIKPIRGIRWRCANCPDFDLCSDCEASDIHDKTHLFFKVKNPAPFLGNSFPPQPIAYPGRPKYLARYLSADQRAKFVKSTTFEMHEIDALYDQFTCLANTRWPADPNKLGAAVDRVAFDRAFVPIASSGVPRPNLIYDRMFAFYDINHDGLIGFEEFINGLACLHQKGKSENRLRRVFEGYDIDSDGYVSRRDFLRMFRAYYSIQKQIVKEILTISIAQDEMDIEGVMDIITSSQPLSAAFTDPLQHPIQRDVLSSKSPNAFGDTRLRSPLLPNSSDSSHRSEIIVNARLRELAAVAPSTDNFSSLHSTLSTNPNLPAGERSVPPDIQSSRAATAAADPSDQALRDRWHRRQFYTDEEEGYTPPARVVGNEPSPVTVPTGYEISQMEKDFGDEILYQVTQQGFNELLDALFKPKEEIAVLLEEAPRIKKALVAHRMATDLVRSTDTSTTPLPNNNDRPYWDPTLPHHRPNDESEIIAYNLAALVNEPPSSDDSDTESGPSREGLVEWFKNVDAVEQEIHERGGAGRLSYEEFECIMKSERGRGLGFVEGWLELGSF